MIDVDQLAEIAVELAARVRDEGPADNARWLDKHLTDPTDLRNLCVVLAAAVPDDRSWQDLTRWAHHLEPVPIGTEDAAPRDRRTGKPLHPCGTRQAAQRHRYHKQQPCDPCLKAERAYEADRGKRRRRAARQGPTIEMAAA